MTTSLASEPSTSGTSGSLLPVSPPEQLKRSPSAGRLFRLAHQHHLEAVEKKKQQQQKEKEELKELLNRRDRSGSTGNRSSSSSSSSNSNRRSNGSPSSTAASYSSRCSSNSSMESSSKKTRKRNGNGAATRGDEINEDTSTSSKDDDDDEVLQDRRGCDDEGDDEEQGKGEEGEEPLMKECCKETHGQVEALLVQLRSVHDESKKKDELIKDLQGQISALQQLLVVSTATRGSKDDTSQGLFELSSPSTGGTAAQVRRRDKSSGRLSDENKEHVGRVDDSQFHNLSSISATFDGDNVVDDNSDVDEDSSVESSYVSTVSYQNYGDEDYDHCDQDDEDRVGDKKHAERPYTDISPVNNKNIVDSEHLMTTMLTPESSFQPLISSPPTYRRGSITLSAATSEHDGSTAIPTSSCHSRSSLLSSASSSFNSSYRSFGGVRGVVDEIQRWLFIEGGNLRDVKSLLKEYSKVCRRTLRIPVDRLAVAGMMLHPKVSAHVWKWEHRQKFTSQDVPSSAFEKPNYNPDEPFAVLMEGRAEEYRMRRPTMDNATTRDGNSRRQRQRRRRSSGRDGENEEHDGESSFTVPPGCSWFNTERYNDYLALPMMYQGKFVGAMAWSTKHRNGFTDDQIQVFKQSLTALSTVLRLHTHEIVQRSLTSRLDAEVASRTHDLAEANQRLIIANKKTDAQAKAQLQHFAMMSHEIRTPLNCIIGLSNLLLEQSTKSTGRKRLDPEVEDSIKMITDSGDLLLAVVDDVLDYSKLASGKVEISVGPTEIRRIMKPVFKSIRVKAKKYGVELRFNITEDLPKFIDTDGRRIQQILYNLMGNAIKYGYNGQYVDLNLTVEHTEAYPGMTCSDMKIVVKDYGKGIAKNELDHIFQPFKQSSSNDPAEGGTGLGLAITKQLCKVLGGDVSVDSKQGHWCEFTVRLPLVPSSSSLPSPSYSKTALLFKRSSSMESRLDEAADGDLFDAADHLDDLDVDEALPPSYSISDMKKSTSTISTMNITADYDDNGNDEKNELEIHPCAEDDEERTLPHSALGAARSVSDMKILIAEDNKINQKVLKRTLVNLDVKNIDIVENGQLAVEQTATNHYDLIFMDWCMPVMDGLEATRIIQARKAQNNNQLYPRIVFLTAHALADYQQKANEVGGDGFISKPFKSDVIKDLLEKFSMPHLGDEE